MENFPLPNISDTLESLGIMKPQYFSTLDLAAGYWQIELEESSESKACFITQDSLYQFQVLPFGLHSAPGVIGLFLSRLRNSGIIFQLNSNIVIV